MLAPRPSPGIQPAHLLVLKHVPRLSRARWFLPATLLLLSVADLLARAGGGHSSGGGSSGGGSHGSSSSGGGGGGDIGLLIDLLRFWFWLVSDYPAFGWPITGVTVYGIYRLYAKGDKAYKGSVIRRGAGAADANALQAGLRELRTEDPGFDVNIFTDRVTNAFTKLQRAWCEQSLVSVRPFISDGIHERFSLQFDEQRALGYRYQMEGLNVRECRIGQIECTPVFDVVTMRIGASAKDQRVSAETGKPIPGSQEASNFVEYWSFIRTRGSKSLLNKAGLIEGQCPNCGAPIELNQGAKCQFCQALLRSGQYDWVLAEITQEGEWSGRTTPPPGTLRIRETDPGFNVQTLEDVTSVIFWRKAAADRLGKIDPMRKVAAPEWCENYATQLTVEPGRARAFQGDCAVSAVDTVGVIPGEPEERALVEVRSLSRNSTVAPDGTVHFIGSFAMRQSLFVLTRRPGTQSLPDKALDSAHCPNCGGAVMADTSNACEFCGTVLNDGAHGWVLRAIWPSTSGEARSLIAQAVAGSARDQPQFESLRSPARSGAGGGLAWMVNAVLTEGEQADDSLREMLRKAAERQSVSESQLDEMIDMATAGQMEIPEPQNAVEARAWVLDMAVAAMASGGISRGEAALLQKVGARYQLGKHDVQQLIARSHKEAYQTAKGELRTARREKRRAG